MFSLMKQVVEPTSNSFLEWKIENFHYWFNKIPELVERAFKRYEEKTNIKLKSISWEEPKAITYHGFSPLNIKILRIETTGKDESSVHIAVPVPTRSDIYEVNASHYIMVCEFVDYPITTYDRILRMRYFRVDQGMFYSGSLEKWPLPVVLVALGLLDPKDIEVVNDISDIDDSVTCLKDGSTYIRYKKFTGQPFDHQILRGFNHLKSLDQLYNKQIIEKLNKFELSTFLIHQLELFYDMTLNTFDTVTIVREMLKKGIEIYNETYDKQYSFGSLQQKYVSYYDMIVEFLVWKMIDNVLQRHQTYKFKVDSHGILKFLVASNPRFQLLSSIETPFREINLKETITTLINNPPPSYRSTHATYLYNIDPINTPDTDKLGIVQRVTKTVQLDVLGRFKEIHV